MRTLALALALPLALAGCKKKEETPPAAPGAGQTPAAAQPATGGAQAPGATGAPGAARPGAAAADPQNPLAALAELGKALGAAQGGAPSNVVNWRQLSGFVPAQLGAWTAKGELHGSTGGVGGFQVSQVSQRYKQGDRRLRIEILDTSASPMMRFPFKMAASLARDTSTGFDKGTNVSGHPAILRWRTGWKRSSVDVLVGDRFLVKVRVHPASSPDEAVSLASQLNLAGLAAVK